MAKTTLVAIEMGYGHLRPAHALGERLGAPVLECDRPPLADVDEQKQWSRARRFYEFGSRLSQLPVVGGPLRSALDSLTFIEPLHPFRDLSAPTAGTRTLERMRQKGMGGGLVEHLGRTGAPLLATFFAPAVIADRAGCESVYCVVTDSDINRVWAPIEAARSRIRYFAPSLRVERRLRAYGVPGEHIEYTGYPLPHELLGGVELDALKRNLAARLVRLDPDARFRQAYRDELQHFLGELPADEERRAPRLTFAVGGAGAQARLARDFLPGFRGLIESGRFRVTLVAGVRDEVAEEFRAAVAAAGLEPQLGRGLEILIEADMPAYFRRFNRLLATTDILWTKPSEITFFAALGLPLVFSWPMGVHERYNRRWAIQAGAGLKQSDPRFAADWIGEWLSDGTLAAAAWSGYMRLPKFGLYRIVEKLEAAQNK
jgi:hypothetical protein